MTPFDLFAYIVAAFLGLALGTLVLAAFLFAGYLLYVVGIRRLIDWTRSEPGPPLRVVVLSRWQRFRQRWFGRKRRAA